MTYTDNDHGEALNKQRADLLAQYVVKVTVAHANLIAAEIVANSARKKGLRAFARATWKLAVAIWRFECAIKAAEMIISIPKARVL